MFNSGCFTGILRIYINHVIFQVYLFCLAFILTFFSAILIPDIFLKLISLLLISYYHTNTFIVLSNCVPFFQITFTSFTTLFLFLFTYFLIDSLRDHNHICVMWLCQLQLDRHSNWRYGSSCAITKTRHGHCCISCTGCRYNCLLHDCVHCRWDMWLVWYLHHSTDPFWNYNNLRPLWVCQYGVNGGNARWLGTDGPQPHPWHVQDCIQGPHSWDCSMLHDRLCGRWGVQIVANTHFAVIERIFARSLPKSYGWWTCQP